MSKKTKIIATIEKETEKAILIDNGDQACYGYWLPKSLININYLKKINEDDLNWVEIELPEWFWVKKVLRL